MAVKNKITETKIDSLIPDNLNANKGTEYGKHLMEKSFRELGAGRSILLDRNNKIIGGNKSVEQCAEIGIDDVIIVETDGTKLVAVKRTDIDIDSVQGRSLAIADNATSKANLSWDTEVLDKIQEEWEVDPKDWGIDTDEVDYSDKNKEIDVDSMDSDMTIKLKYVEDDYWKVKEALSKIATTPEQAVYKLLGL